MLIDSLALEEEEEEEEDRRRLKKKFKKCRVLDSIWLRKGKRKKKEPQALIMDIALPPKITPGLRACLHRKN